MLGQLFKKGQRVVRARGGAAPSSGATSPNWTTPTSFMMLNLMRRDEFQRSPLKTLSPRRRLMALVPDYDAPMGDMDEMLADAYENDIWPDDGPPMEDSHMTRTPFKKGTYIMDDGQHEPEAMREPGERQAEEKIGKAEAIAQKALEDLGAPHAPDFVSTLAMLMYEQGLLEGSQETVTRRIDYLCSRAKAHDAEDAEGIIEAYLLAAEGVSDEGEPVAPSDGDPLKALDEELRHLHRQIKNPSGFRATYIQVPPLITRMNKVLGKENWSMTCEIGQNMVCVTVEVVTASGYVKRMSDISGFALAPLPSLAEFADLTGNVPLFDGGTKYAASVSAVAKEYGILMKAMNEHNQNAIKEAATDAMRRAIGRMGPGGYLWDKTWHEQNR